MSSGAGQQETSRGCSGTGRAAQLRGNWKGTRNLISNKGELELKLSGAQVSFRDPFSIEDDTPLTMELVNIFQSYKFQRHFGTKQFI